MKPCRISRVRAWLAQEFACAYRRLLNFSEKRKLAVTAASVLIGVLLALKTDVSASVWFALSIAACTGTVLCRTHRRVLAGVMMLLTVMFLFAGYAGIVNEKPDLTVEKKSEITGYISSKPKEQPDKHRTTFLLEDVTIQGEAFEDKIYVYAYAAKEGEYEYGQRVEFTSSSLWVPDGVTNPHGFDFRQYLWRKGTALCASVSAYDVTVASGRNSVTRCLYAFSDSLSKRIEDLFPKNSDLIKALLVGDRSSLSDETYDNFKISGIAHLVALSGLHVSCIAAFLNGLFVLCMLPRRLRGILVIACLIVYAWMTGASASILRAVFMYAYYVLCRETGHKSDLLTRLSFAFLLQMVINPMMLEDTGMQLSYLSVLSLVFLTGSVRELLPRAGGIFRKSLNAMSASFSVQMGTLPQIATQFHSVSLLSVPVNLVLVPLALVSVYLSAAALVLSFVSMRFARIVALPSELIWDFIRLGSAWVSDFSFSRMNVRAWSFLASAGFFALMVFSSAYFMKRRIFQRVLTGLLILIALFVSVRPAPDREGLTFVFLDVGYADGCVMYSGRNAYVVDTGKDNGIVADYLTASGAEVRGVFITHPDSDHAGGAAEILLRYPEAEVYVSECWDRMDVSETTKAALEGKKMHYLSAGDERLIGDGVKVCVLWPKADYAPDNDNDGSLVLNIGYRGVNTILTGDITDEEDENLFADGDILKVSHHGSKYATTDTFLSRVTPAISVISVSSNGHGHPTPEVLSRLHAVGSEVYRTDECGAITINIDEQGKIHLSTMLSNGSN